MHDRMIQIKRKITYIDRYGDRKSKDIVVKKTIKGNADNVWFAKYMNVGYYLAVPLIVGVFGGNWLDQQCNTKPVFTIILLFLGSIAAFYNLYKLLKNA